MVFDCFLAWRPANFEKISLLCWITSDQSLSFTLSSIKQKQTKSSDLCLYYSRLLSFSRDSIQFGSNVTRMLHTAVTHYCVTVTYYPDDFLAPFLQTVKSSILIWFLPFKQANKYKKGLKEVIRSLIELFDFNGEYITIDNVKKMEGKHNRNGQT
jgi:hypothetical protein